MNEFASMPKPLTPKDIARWASPGWSSPIPESAPKLEGPFYFGDVRQLHDQVGSIDSIERIHAQPGKEVTLKDQAVEIPEYMGPTDGFGNNMVATFELFGLSDEPVEFAILRRLDGTDAVSAAAANLGLFPQGVPAVENVPALTIVPTKYLGLIRKLQELQKNKAQQTPEQLVAISDQIPRIVVRAGQRITIGRETFPLLLGSQTSRSHVTIEMGARNSSDYQDAQVIIADHSTNGTTVRRPSTSIVP